MSQTRDECPQRNWSSMTHLRKDSCNIAQKTRNEARSQRQGQSDSKWYVPLRHSKRNHHPKFGIPTSNNIGDMLWTQKILKTRSEVKVTVTQKWFVTLRHAKMHLHTKFGIPISKNIGDMHQFLETRSEVKFKGHSD